MKELDKIVKTKAQIIADGNSIENNIIEDFDINIIRNFVTFEIGCRNCYPFSGFNNTANLGYIIKAVIELFDLDEEDGARIGKLKNIPCRIITEKDGGWGSKVIGIGNFMADKFVYSADLAEIGRRIII
jgi:hypothetical protein